MTNHFRLSCGLIALFAASSLTPAQAPHPTSSAIAGAAAKSARDLGPAAPESVGISAERLPRLDAAMKRLVDEKQVAGLVTMLGRHGKVVHFGTAGQLDVCRPDPLQKDSIFRIYSMTKPVTGVANDDVVRRGKWRLDDPVSRYSPELGRLKVYLDKNEDGSPKLEDARRSMTTRELMTHTAGLGYILNPNTPVDRMIIDAHVLNERAPLQSMIDGLSKMPLLAHPSTRWSYSIAVGVQGYLVEKFSGQPFGEFVRTRIFEPAGSNGDSAGPPVVAACSPQLWTMPGSATCCCKEERSTAPSCWRPGPWT